MEQDFSTDHIFRIKDLSYSWDPLAHENSELLKNLSFDIQKGEKIICLGPSGQGKSTLLKLICGLLPLQKGKVFWSNQDLQSLDPKAKKKWLLKMGFLFQKNALFDSMTAIENVRFPIVEQKKFSAHEVEEKSQQLLDSVGLLSAQNKFPNELSGGMQKRLALARTLALDPEIIFYDDPTAGLDPITSRKIIDLILQFQAQRKSTLIAIVNDLNRARQIQGKVLFLAMGRILFFGLFQDLKKSPDPAIQQFIQGLADGPLTTIYD